MQQIMKVIESEEKTRNFRKLLACSIATIVVATPIIVSTAIVHNFFLTLPKKEILTAVEVVSSLFASFLVTGFVSAFIAENSNSKGRLKYFFPTYWKRKYNNDFEIKLENAENELIRLLKSDLTDQKKSDLKIQAYINKKSIEDFYSYYGTLSDKKELSQEVNSSKIKIEQIMDRILSYDIPMENWAKSVEDNYNNIDLRLQDINNVYLKDIIKSGQYPQLKQKDYDDITKSIKNKNFDFIEALNADYIQKNMFVDWQKINTIFFQNYDLIDSKYYLIKDAIDKNIERQHIKATVSKVEITGNATTQANSPDRVKAVIDLVSYDSTHYKELWSGIQEKIEHIQKNKSILSMQEAIQFDEHMSQIIPLLIKGDRYLSTINEKNSKIVQIKEELLSGLKDSFTYLNDLSHTMDDSLLKQFSVNKKYLQATK